MCLLFMIYLLSKLRKEKINDQGGLEGKGLGLGVCSVEGFV